MISSIVFDRFKALKNNPILFGKITVLAGFNSAGKSSVIQGLLLLRSVAEHLKVSGGTAAGVITDFPLNGNYLLSLGSTIETIAKDTGKEFVIIPIEDDIPIPATFYTEISLSDSQYHINVKTNEDLINCSIGENDFFYLNAERLGPRIRHWINERGSTLHCGYRGEYTVEVLARTKNRSDLYGVAAEKYLRRNKLAGFQDIPSYAAEWMKFITPGSDLGAAEIIGKIRSATIELNGSSPPNVGFGISYALPIVVTGLLAKPGSIMVVENPEAHLHPKGQSNIGYFLGQMATAGIQVIIETHSEHVINGLRKATLESKDLKSEDLIINFFKGINPDSQAEVSIIKMKENGNLTDSPVDFFDQTRQDLLEILRLTGR